MSCVTETLPTMAPLFLVLALIIQGSFIHAHDEDESIDRKILDNSPELSSIDTEWIDLFTLPLTSSAAKMAAATNSEIPAEERVEMLKHISYDLMKNVDRELKDLILDALTVREKETHENGLRKRRSAETPMDSSQLVTRLLRHIKSSNEYQNIAIEKMMTAQEIADKFGIEYNPDPEILTDFAAASSKQAVELASILKDVAEIKNVTREVEFVPIADEPVVKATENDTYYSYSVHPEDIAAHLNEAPSYEYVPEYIQHPRPQVTHHHEQYPHYNHPCNNHYETQLPPPPQFHRSPPVSPVPHFYEPIPYTPAPEYYPVYYPEPVTTTTTIVFPIEEVFEPEPELVGEEFEETISSKVLVERGDEPGSATVNHMTTYTISEKSHFKKPEIVNLPQQMQYYFFLV